jgi:hypothetical protein
MLGSLLRSVTNTIAPLRYAAEWETYSLLSLASGHKFSIRCECTISSQSLVSEDRNVPQRSDVIPTAVVAVYKSVIYTEFTTQETRNYNW